MAQRRALDDPFAAGGAQDPSLSTPGSPFEVSAPGMSAGDGSAPPPLQDFGFDTPSGTDPFKSILPDGGTPTIPATAAAVQPTDLLTPATGGPARVARNDPGAQHPYHAATDANGSFLAPDGTILTGQTGPNTWSGADGSTWELGPDGQPRQVTAQSSGGGPQGGGAPSVNEVTLPGVPTIANDPLSGEIDKALAGILGTGKTDYGKTVEDALTALIGKGGLTQPIQGQLNSARDAEATAEQGMLADARNALAGAGTLSEPGTPQGPTSDAISRIAYNLAPTYAKSVSDIETNAMNTANSNVMSALSLATGLSENEAANVLSASGSGTARQSTLANIALSTLAQSADWNKFLATYGLNRDQIQAQLAQGQSGQVLQLLSLFLQLTQQKTAGFI